MFLTNAAGGYLIPSYCQLADLKDDTTLDLTDKTGATLSDATLTGLLQECSGVLDSRIGTSYLPQEQTVQRKGDGTFYLDTGRYPLIYLRQVKVVLPTSVGWDIPIQGLKVDYETGIIQNMTPLYFQTGSISTLFPRGTPIDVTLAWGIGFPIAPPAFTVAYTGSSSNPIAAGSHNFQVTSWTQNGESLPSAPVNFTLPAPGAVKVTITTTPGALRYFVYIDGEFVGEIVAQAIGDGTVSLTFDATPSVSPNALVWSGSAWIARTPPTQDQSATQFFGRFAGLKECTKLLVQQRVWEQKNPSNQGIYSKSSGPKRIMYKDAMHGANIYANRIDDIVNSLKFQGIV